MLCVGVPSLSCSRFINVRYKCKKCYIKWSLDRMQPQFGLSTLLDHLKYYFPSKPLYRWLCTGANWNTLLIKINAYVSRQISSIKWIGLPRFLLPIRYIELVIKCFDWHTTMFSALDVWRLVRSRFTSADHSVNLNWLQLNLNLSACAYDPGV